MARYLRNFHLLFIACLSLTLGATRAQAQKIEISDQCYLPGVYASDLCSIHYGWSGNTSNSKLCLWDGDSLNDCEGYTNYANSFDWVTAAGHNLEIRRHAVWPTSDPDWPNAAKVRSKGVLLLSKRVTGVSVSVPPLGACTTTLSPGTSIRSAVAAAPANAVICLDPGTHVDSEIDLKAGQILRGTSSINRPIIQNNNGTSSRTINVSEANVTIRDLVVTGQAGNPSGFGILVYVTSGTRIENVDSNYAIIGIGINGGTDIQVNHSKISYAGDGRACSGCAQPSMWTTDSNNVRILNTQAVNNGVGPEGDGEIASYNTPNLLIQNTTVNGSGASGLYIVNCDHAIIAGNVITGVREWGLDIVDTGYSSGSDYGLFLKNTVGGSRNGGAVLLNSVYAVFHNNSFIGDRTGPRASGSCNGINRRGNTTGFNQSGDTSSPSGASCSD